MNRCISERLVRCCYSGQQLSGLRRQSVLHFGLTHQGGTQVMAGLVDSSDERLFYINKEASPSCHDKGATPCYPRIISSSDLAGGQGLVDVRQDIVDMLDADGEAHHIGGYPGPGVLLVVELAVGGGGRDRRAALGVADVDQPQDHAKGVVETRPRLAAALDAEAEDPRGAAPHVL